LVIHHRAKADYGSAASALHKLVINCGCILCDVHYPVRVVLEGLGYEIQNLAVLQVMRVEMYILQVYYFSAS
jgi:hypothetical protein